MTATLVWALAVARPRWTVAVRRWVLSNPWIAAPAALALLLVAILDPVVRAALFAAPFGLGHLVTDLGLWGRVAFVTLLVVPLAVDYRVSPLGMRTWLPGAVRWILRLALEAYPALAGYLAFRGVTRIRDVVAVDVIDPAVPSALYWIATACAVSFALGTLEPLVPRETLWRIPRRPVCA